MKLIVALVLVVVCCSSVSAQAEAGSGELERRFRKADLDGDGKLSTVEAKQASWFVDEVQRFDSIDSDHSGTVTLVEITAAIAGQVADWLGADIDKDGRVSEAEAKRQNRLSSAFGNADADRDGQVTRDEIERLSQRSYYRDAELPAVAPNIIEKRF